MNFNDAIEHMMQGHKVTHPGFPEGDYVYISDNVIYDKDGDSFGYVDDSFVGYQGDNNWTVFEEGKNNGAPVAELHDEPFDNREPADPCYE